MIACTQGSTSASPMPDRAAHTVACAGTNSLLSAFNWLDHAEGEKWDERL